jgi:glycosyltransferase involved in cell wall biosynthesis
MQSLSVIICTYNPKPDIFSKCLNCIVEASKQYAPHEIIVVDNKSDKPVSGENYIIEHLKYSALTRIVVEEKQGLTPARLRGIKESHGSVLVFIDDDNFIKPDFLINVMKIAEEAPYIGSFSGQVKLIFEVRPPAWTRRYWGLLVYREFKGSRWSNLPHLPETMPCGAGLVVRREVAEQYTYLHNAGKRNVQLDRTGASLLSAGDNDLAACACDVGLGVGIYDSLVLEHYIPGSRLTKDYLLRLAESIAHSAIVFKSFRGEFPIEPTFKRRVANKLRVILKKGVQREFQKAVFKGEHEARALLAKLKNVV